MDFIKWLGSVANSGQWYFWSLVANTTLVIFSMSDGHVGGGFLFPSLLAWHITWTTAGTEIKGWFREQRNAKAKRQTQANRGGRSR